MFTYHSRKRMAKEAFYAITGFRWIGPDIFEKVLSSNIYLVRKTGTNKTQMLHRMRLRQFPPRQPIPNI